MTTNNAPINTSGGAFAATTEDGSAVEMTVADFLSQKASASDVDSHPLGIAVTATNPGWEYWNGSVWYGFDKFAAPLSNTNACLLAPNTPIRYNPTRDFNGTASFTYKVWDQTADSYDPALLQGAGNTMVGTAYSTDSKQATIEVTPVNDAPYLGSTRLIGHFDGADDFVDLPNMTFGGDMTIEAWIYVTQHGTWSRIVELTQAGDRTNNVIFGFESTTGQLVYENNIDGNAVGHIIGAYIQPNQWTHVAITHSSAGPATLYVNGAVSTSGNFAAVANVLRDDNLIGKSHWSGDANFSGDMHDVRIWTTVRTQTEIVAGMNQSLTTADGLLANYVLNTDFQDSSVNNLDGTTQGTLNGPAVIQLAAGYQAAYGLEDTTISLAGVVVLDVDDGDSAVMSVSLGVPSGLLTFSSTTGLSFTTGDGTADASMVFTGTKAAINAAFATLSYQPVANANGTVAMTYAIIDSGAGGSNGPQTGNFTRDIVIIPVDDAPTITIGSIALSADTGTSTTDFITQTASQTITATLSGAPAGTDKVFGSVDSGANWIDITSMVSDTTLTWTGVTLAGSSSLKFKVTDAAGHDGSVTSQAYVLDTTAPVATIATIAFSADTGSSGTDFITNSSAQNITGTVSANMVAGEIVQVSLDNGATWLTATTTVGSDAWGLTHAISAGTAPTSTLKVRVTDAAGNSGPVSSQAYVLDTTAPTLTFSSPADDAIGVSISNNLTLTFSEALASNSGVIELHKSSDGWLVESFTLSSSNVAGAVVTLNPTADLDYSTEYYLTTGVAQQGMPAIGHTPPPSTGIQDLAGNAFAGITNTTTLNFTTAAPDNTGGGGSDSGGGDTGGGSTSGGDDQDGVDASVEDSVPGLQPTNGGTAVAGDGNGDGIKDSAQPAVSSLTFLKTDTSVSNPGAAPKVFVTLVADAKDGQVNAGSKAVITSIAQKDAPANLPEGAKLPLGLFDFTAKAAAPGSSENFSIFIDGDITVNGYWKEVHSGASAGTWVNLADATYGGKIVTEQGKTRLDFTIQDGGIFDDDGKADGTISDPGGPGFMVQAAAPTCPFDPFRIDADKDGMTDAVELLRGSSSAIKNNDVFSHNDLFVDQLYRDFFGREGYGDAGSAYWLNAMSSGAMSRTDVLTTALNSPEFDSHAGVVIRLYHATLGRSPELCGYNYWLGQANAGVNASEMGQAFLDSAEFATKQIGLDNAGFVDLLYQNVLQRAPEATGRAYWIDQLQTGKTDRGGMLYSMVQSQEFKAAMVDDVAVDILYLGLLDRSANSAETAYWMGQYGNYANSSAFLQAASAATSEYQDRFVPSDGSTHAAALVGVLDEQAAG